MNFRFAKIISSPSLQISGIREVLKLTNQKEIISFAGGFPAAELFPAQELAVLSANILREESQVALQYSSTEGFLLLRELIAKQRMEKTNVQCIAEDILITAGAQQGIDLVSRMFIDRGDYIICESPTYLGALNTFKAAQAQFLPIEMDKDGMNLEHLEQTLQKYPQAKLIYTIPDFQNPSGSTMSLARRQKLADMAAQYQIPILEDNPNGELIFKGDPYPSIKSFDKDGWVIYLSSFSKTLCPGYRIGWICAAQQLIYNMTMIKQATDLQSSTIAQREIAYYMRDYNMDMHIKKVKEIYQKRRDIMIGAMEECFPLECSWSIPGGGLFMWVKLAAESNANTILVDALQQNVAFVPGSAFFAQNPQLNFLRLNYSNMPEERIIEGIQRLAKVLKAAK